MLHVIIVITFTQTLSYKHSNTSTHIELDRFDMHNKPSILKWTICRWW